MRTRGQLVSDVRTRLGDLAAAIWSDDEIGQHVVNGYQQIAMTAPIFWDQTYLENLPRGMSYTQPWERVYAQELGFDYGCANYTMADERRLLGDERQRIGPGNHTSPFEVYDGWLTDVHASPAIPATAELPATLTALLRVTWDKRGIDAMEARRLSRVDARYEITQGEVYGYLWQKDGIRTLRKIRVPAAQSDTVVVNGNLGILRTPTTLSAATVSGTWGIPRRIPGCQPIGPEVFGTPRRPYLDGKNVRVEYARQGRAMDHAGDACELPDRYATYLRDYAQGKCLERVGPGQDLALAAHFAQRWARGVARVVRRLQTVDTEHVLVFGGDGQTLGMRPPRPKLPWPYGATVR